MSIRIEFEGIETQFYDETGSFSWRPTGRQNVTADADDDTVLVWSDYIVGTIGFKGEYAGPQLRKLREIMRAGRTIDAKVRDDAGSMFEGSVGFSFLDFKDGKKKVEFSFAASFTGAVTELDAKSQTARTVGTKLGLKSGQRLVLGYQDTRMDRYVRPWYTDGLSNDSSGLHDALAGVVTTAGGNEAKVPFSESLRKNLFLHHGTAQPFGRRAATGTLVYARGPVDCSPAFPESQLGWIDFRGTEGGAVESLSSGGPCDVAGITIPNIQKKRVAVKSIRVKCVWADDEPQETADMVATINSAGYTIVDRSYAAFTLRFDGYTMVPYDTPAGVRYVGHINWTWLQDGWTSHKLICINYKPVDVGSTFPSYVLQFETQQRYLYPSFAFTALEDMCPRCFGSSAV